MIKNPGPWRHDGDTLTLFCRVHPGARQNRVLGLHDKRIKIQLQAPAVDGKANKALIRFVADLCNCPVSSVSIDHGLTSRQKTIRIRPVSRIPEVINELTP